MKRFSKILLWALTFALVIGSFPAFQLTAMAASNVPYIDENGNPQTAPTATDLTGGGAITLTDGWYLASGNITYTDTVTISGTVHLILADGCDMKVTTGTFNAAGIRTTGATLHIYGQATGTGSLTATGGNNGAGIGGGYLGAGGNIIICGGSVTANGNNGGAGIGGGSSVGGGGGAGGNITINGGTVTANGSAGGAGIGGGRNGNGGTFTINNGTVTVTGGNNGAGIGGGDSAPSGIGGAGGTIKITGGTIEAKAGNTGNAAAIGKGNNGADGAITVTGTYNYWTNTTNTAPGTMTGHGTFTYSNTYKYIKLVARKSAGTTIDMSDASPAVSGTGWTYSGNVYTIASGANVTVIGNNQQPSASERRITVAASATASVTLNGVSITGLNNYQSPLLLNNGAGVTLTLTGTNTLTAGHRNAGIQTANATLTINGTGILTVTGGDLGAGIGSSYGSPTGVSGGTIIIENGTIIANGGSTSAGIGGGCGNNIGGSGGSITINGGTVTANGSNDSAGIGGGGSLGSSGGSGGNITINGGTVMATGGNNGAGIGGGTNGNGGTITINGGTIEAKAGSTGNSAAIGKGQNGADGTVTITGAYNYWTNTTNTAPSTMTGHGTFNYSNTYKYIKLVETAATVPGVPLLSSATAGDASITLTWTAPASDGGSVITTYQYSTDGTNWKDLAGASPQTITQTSAVGSNPLVNGTQYTVSVRAVNAVGNSIASNSINATPLAPTYGVTLSENGTHTFTGQTVGYSPISPFSITVMNNGNQPTGALNVALFGTNSGSFTLSTGTLGSIAVSGNDTFTVKPNDGLAVGTYTATVTISGGSGITASFGISFTVNAAFVPVTNITGVPTTATAGTPLALSGTVVPSGATNQTIIWSVQNAGTTGATVTGNTLNTTAAGSVTVRATITNGTAVGTNYTQDFTITVNAQTYTVTVSSTGTSSSGGGSFAQGATVTINAGTAPTGQQFSHWTASPAVTFANANSANTTFAMIGQVVTVTANWKTITNIAVHPNPVDVERGTTEQFSATVNGTNNPDQTVTWAVTGGGAGTSINSTTGLLTVASGETATTLTVTATSTVDTTKSGSATVTLTNTPPTIIVTGIDITPATITLNKGGTHTFSADVHGTNPPQGVMWTVTGGGAGTSISTSGLLTIAATETATTLTIRATSTTAGFTTIYGEATVTVNQPPAHIPVTSITGVPTTATAGTPLTLTGTVNPTTATNQTITWSVQNAGTTGATFTGDTLNTTAAGTVTVRATITNGLTASTNYTQDFTITVNAQTYTVTVSSTGTGVTGSGSFAQGATVSINAGTAPTGQQFSHWTASPAVTFANANSANTTFTMIGQVVTITANWKTITNIAVHPNPVDVERGTTEQFSATVNGTNSPDQAVTWAVTGGGAGTSINSTTGLLTVASGETATTLTVTATSTIDTTKSGSAMVTLTNTPPTIIVTGIDITPATITLNKGDTHTFSADVHGTNPPQGVTWTVTGGGAGTSISTSGLLTIAATETATTLTIRATSTTAGFTTIYGEATVTVYVPTTIINIAAIPGVTAPVRSATPVTTITDTAQYTGTVSWSPSVSSAFAASTAYTATITITPKAGFTLTGVAANFFTVAGATSVAHSINSGVITTVFPATGSTGAGGGSSGGGGSGGDGGSGSNNPTTPKLDGKATDKLIADAVKEAEKKGGDAQATVTIDLSGVKGAKSATFDVAAAKAFAESDVAVVVKFPDSGITVGVEGLAILGNAHPVGTTPITVEAAVIPMKDLSGMQAAQVKGYETVINIDVFVGDTKIDIPLTISLPYTLKANENPAAVCLWRMDDNGNLTRLEAVYDAKTGMITFSITHQSYFIVGYDPVVLWANIFSDIAEDAWYYDAVAYSNYYGLFGGYGGDIYAPADSMTRAMFVTALHKLEDGPKPNGAEWFNDVAISAWYHDPVQWAAENGIVNGVDGGFNPNKPVTRQEMAVILYNYAGFKGYDIPENRKMPDYTDYNQIGLWAETPATKLSEAGVLNGGNNAFMPKKDASRAEVAQMFKNFLRFIVGK